MRRLAEAHRNLCVVGDPGPVDLQVARRRPAQHPGLRGGLPRRAGRPARAQLPVDAGHPRRRVGGHQPEPQPQGEAALDRHEGRRQDPLPPGERRARGGGRHRARRAVGRAHARRHADGRALPDQRAVARDRGRAAPRGRRVPHRRERPVLRAEGGQGHARVPEAAPQPGRRREPAAGDQRADARHRQGRDGRARRPRRPGLGLSGEQGLSPHSLWSRLVGGPRSRRLHRPRGRVAARLPRPDARAGARWRGRSPSRSRSARCSTRSGYLAALREDRTEEAQSRVENLAELVSAAKEYELREPDATLGGFVDRLSLLSDADEAEGAADARVMMMTLHSAKGLEFPVVFIAGLEEGLFPHSRSTDDEAELEEERRLCYVGMTRARRKLYLGSANRRRWYGEYRPSQPSRFIDEVPEELLEREEPAGRRRAVRALGWRGRRRIRRGTGRRATARSGRGGARPIRRGPARVREESAVLRLRRRGPVAPCRPPRGRACGSATRSSASGRCSASSRWTAT